MAVHPLRPATYHGLGEPLPHQLANRTQSSPAAHIAFIRASCEVRIISGISIRFQMLSQTAGQVLYALLTRPPPSPEGSSRLACVKHSVSVHPEPGSNSSFNLYNSVKFTDCLHQIIIVFALIVFLYSVVNVLIYSFVCHAFSRTRYILPQIQNFVNTFF